jgi:endopeptidase La
MNTDIDKYLDYVKNNSKRTGEMVDNDDILKDLTESTMQILLHLADQLPMFKGRELTKFIMSMKEDFKQSMEEIKNNIQLKGVDKVLKLASIAIQARCCDILDDVYEYSMTYRNESFKSCLNKVNTTYTKEVSKFQIKFHIANPHKKAKLMKEEKEVYEEASDYHSSDEEEQDYGDNDDNDDDDSDDDEEEDPEQEAKNKLLSNKDNQEFIQHIFKTREEDPETKLLNYYANLPSKERKDALSTIREIKSFQNSDKPIIFRIMEMPLPINQKNHILKNYTTLSSSRFPDNKLRNWFDSLMTIPFGKYNGISLNSIKPSKVKSFLDNLQKVMDGAVYGHNEAKRQIIQMMGQQIRNPKSKGNVLGIWGPPGNGKTSLVKEGIAKAMGKPMEIIALGGATDSSFLEGHSYTYEGSIYGRIVNALISSKCMDPILYFDELDKISQTHKGEEITNILVHLTDPAQNTHFRDKYFHGVDIDLSRATMIFSFNDPSNVNPILLDRITTVETKYLLTNQKIHIATNYLLKDMMKEMNFKENDVTLDSDTMSTLITKYTNEGGVRKLKSLLYSIVRELNLANLMKISLGVGMDKVVFPFVVTTKHLKILLKDKHEIEPDKIHTEDKSGIINGLWANSMGQGGVLSLQTIWLPSQTPLSIKATGNLEKVIKESTEVACSVAWSYLSDDVKTKYMTEWKDKPMGFHIHCPDGATPKDGPSAGCALTLSVYSLLMNRKIRHDVAITGEINLQGNVTAIGGLENKLEGAKKAGIKLAMYPKENEKDIKKIKDRNPTLIDNNFKVLSVETFEDAMKHAFI